MLYYIVNVLWPERQHSEKYDREFYLGKPL